MEPELERDTIFASELERDTIFEPELKRETTSLSELKKETSSDRFRSEIHIEILDSISDTTETEHQATQLFNG